MFYELLDVDVEYIKKELYLYFTRAHYNKFNFLSKLDKESLEYKKFIDLIVNNESLYIKVGNDRLKHEYKVSITMSSECKLPMSYNCKCSKKKI